MYSFFADSIVNVPLDTPQIQGALDMLTNIALASVAGVLAWAGRSIPSSLAFMLKTKIAEQWLEKAIHAAHNEVEGAIKGQVLSFDVGNDVVAEATQMIVDYAPAWLVKWLGGWDGIEARILARLHIESAKA